MKARRLSFRLAIRRLRCDRRRTAVIVAVMMVPLTAAVFLSTVRATRSVPEDVQVAAQAGRAQSVVLNQQLVFARGTPAALDEMPDALAAAVGRRVDMTPEVTGSVAVTVGDRQVDAVGYGLLLQDPINRGRFRIQRGHAAQRDDEVVLSTSVADRLDVGVGDTVVLGGEGQELVVTGLTAVRHDTTRRFIVGTPRAVARTVAGRDPENEPLPGQTTAVVSWQLPSRVELDLAARQDGWQVRQREEIVALVGEEAQLNRDETLPWILGGTVLILAELGLILAAVFAVVARSNRRELGLLATAGAGPGFRRRVIVAQGALSGVLAMVAASAVGIVGVVLAAPTLAARSHQIWGTLRIDPRTLAVLTVLGVGTPSLAARVAARGVGTDVVAALQDRPAEVTRRTRTLLSRLGVVLAGVVMVAVGGMGAQASLVILGAVTSVVGVVILGAAASESWLQRIRLPGLLPRLAFRTMTRALGRAAALATVLASLTVLCALVLAALGGFTKDAESRYVPRLPDGDAFIYATQVPRPVTVSTMTEALHIERIVPLGLASPPRPDPGPTGAFYQSWGVYRVPNVQTSCPSPAGGAPVLCSPVGTAGGEPPAVVVLDAQDLGRVLGRPSTPKERAALADGQAVVLDRRLAPDGQVTVTAPDSAPGSSAVIEKQLPAVVASERARYPKLPTVYIAQAGLDALGGVAQPDRTYLYAPTVTGRRITTGQEDRARATLAADIGPTFFAFDVERGSPAARDLRVMTLAAVVLLILVSVTLASLTVALATQELRPDLSALAAAGASRRFRRGLTGMYAGMVVLVGTAAGLLVALAVTPALLGALRTRWSLLPWAALLGTSAASVAAATIVGYVGGARVTTLLRRAE